MSGKAFSHAQEFKGAFLAHMAARLDTLICEQCKVLFEDAGIKAPVTSMSIFVFLMKYGEGSISDICKIGGQSHQLTASRIKALIQLDMVELKKDETDKRKQLVAFTQKGLNEVDAIAEALKSVSLVFEDLNRELGVDLLLKLEEAERSLTRFPLNERIQELETGL